MEHIVYCTLSVARLLHTVTKDAKKQLAKFGCTVPYQTKVQT